MYSRLSICIFVRETKIAQFVMEKLRGDRYRLHQVYSPEKLLEYVEENKEQIDCLIFARRAEARIIATRILRARNFAASNYYPL